MDTNMNKQDIIRPNQAERFEDVDRILEGNYQPGTTAGYADYYGVGVSDNRAEYSVYGPRVDVFAPGSAIQSVWVATDGVYDYASTPDPRAAVLGVADVINNNFKKCPGTSMSGPQVTGVLACLAEKYPRMTQADARAYIKHASTKTLISSNGGAAYGTDVGIRTNSDVCQSVLFFHDTRIPEKEVGGIQQKPWPPSNDFYRPVQGAVYPRKKSLDTMTPLKNATFAVSAFATASLATEAIIYVHTENVPDGTKIPYIITQKQPPAGTTARVPRGVSAVCTANAIVTSASINNKINQGNRIVTVAGNGSRSTYIPLNFTSTDGLTESTSPTVGNSDDGYWSLTLPFNVSFLGQTYSTIGVGTNSYITFGSGQTVTYPIDAENPPLPKILIAARDYQCDRIYYGTKGTAPNRTFTVRYNASIYENGQQPVLHEVTFYEATPDQIDVMIDSRDPYYGSWGRVGCNIDPMDPDFWLAPGDLTVPFQGTVTINNNQASLIVAPYATSKQAILNFRLGIFPTPDADVYLNIY